MVVSGSGRPGQQITIKGITVEAVAAYNIGKAFRPKANQWCGAVFTMGGKYTLIAEEACLACKAIAPRAAIPYHWGDIIDSIRDAEDFVRGAGCKVHLLQPGQTVNV